MSLAARAYCLVVRDSRDGLEHLDAESLSPRRSAAEETARQVREFRRGEFFRPWEEFVGIAEVELREVRRMPMPP